MPDAAPLVYLVDDDPAVQRSVEAALLSEAVAVQALEPTERFEDELKPSRPGCIILSLPKLGVDEIKLLLRLHESASGLPLILMSAQSDLMATVQALKIGVFAFVQKPPLDSELVSVVMRAIRANVETHHRNDETESYRQRFDTLTARERDLLRLIVEGMSSKEIARRLNISNRTVANHRAHLMSKTGATNAAHLARLSLLLGVLDPE